MTFRIKCPSQQQTWCWVVTLNCMWSVYICLFSHVTRPWQGHKSWSSQGNADVQMCTYMNIHYAFVTDCQQQHY